MRPYLHFLMCVALSLSVQVSPVRADPPPDIIVVGAGIAGLSTALEAARGGARVTVVELSSVFGGHAVMSGGNLCIVATPLQEKFKISDSAELAAADFRNWGEDADPGWVRYYVERSRAEIYDWVTPMGVEFSFVVPHDGNTVPRLHFTRGKGLALVAPIYRECLKAGVQFAWNHEVVDLVVERGRVAGVTARELRSGQRRKFNAGAVVLATGGFQSNLQMVRRHWPEWLPSPQRLLSGAGRYATGSGHAIAERAGAALVNLDHQWNYAIGLPDPRDPARQRGLAAFNPAAIWVNADGKRFVNEFAGAKTSAAALLRQKGQTYWSIFDEAAKRSLGVTLAGWSDFQQIERVIFDNPELVKSAPALPELAAKIGVPPAALAETIERYNRQVAERRDTDFGRFGPTTNPKPAAIEKPPFYAARFFPITRKSMGGVRIDLSCRVLNVNGKPIPGLYAAGEVAGFGGINGKAALEGTFLGPSIVTGRVAARTILAALPRRVRAQPPRALLPTERDAAFPDSACTGCHNLDLLLARTRPGYWHFEKSHRAVVDRSLSCHACHAELHPYIRRAHRINRASQIDNCKSCHGG